VLYARFGHFPATRFVQYSVHRIRLSDCRTVFATVHFNYRVLNMLRRSTIAGVIAVSSLAGCAVGPNFHAPAAPGTSNYTRGQTVLLAPQTRRLPGEPPRHSYLNRDIPADWYGLFSV